MVRLPFLPLFHENGGEGVLLHIQRCQAFKVAQRGYQGKGGRVVKKGDCVLTDCNVTGTDTGTPDKPKFALRPLWEYCLLPSLDALVGEGGQCEGAVVVHQEDNAGKALNLTHDVTQSLTLTLLLSLIVQKDRIRREDFING